MKLSIVSLGCPKNQVDADIFCRALLDAGHEITAAADMADVIIINTCGFIDSAKEEAIEAILQACALKEQKPGLRVVVTGCLAERYRRQVADEIPEVDAVLGIGANGELPALIARFAGEDAQPEPFCLFPPKALLPLGGRRIISTPGHYAWLKLSEGCSNACSYCAIPMIRGPLRSRPMEDVVAEARWLAGQGVRELVLVAQDVTAYGDDGGENELVPLLRRLDGIEGLRWIRLLYTYPERITEALLDVMAASDKILPYLDIPIQHISEGILRSMRRKGGPDAIHRAIALVRDKLPGAVLRTSLIAGYPGETEQDFDELCDFVRQARFDRLGCFAYSPEEGTVAARLPGQLPEEERHRRAKAVMQLQSLVMEQKQQEMIGRTVTVLCDGWDEEEGWWLCRSAADAPEIDANVLVGGEEEMHPGEFYEVRIVGADVYDLYAERPDEH